MMDDRLLTVREASETMALRESTLRKWILERRIAVCRLGRAVRIPARVVRQMIESGYRDAVPVRGAREDAR